MIAARWRKLPGGDWVLMSGGVVILRIEDNRTGRFVLASGKGERRGSFDSLGAAKSAAKAEVTA